MKKIMFGLGFLYSLSLFAMDAPTEKELNKAIDRAELATKLWFCDAEEALNRLVDFTDAPNGLGCEGIIKEAKLSLDSSEIITILNQHIAQLKQIQEFQEEVRASKNYNQLIPSVKALKANGISLNLVRRNANFTSEEIVIVELSFEKSKTELERAIDELY